MELAGRWNWQVRRRRCRAAASALERGGAVARVGLLAALGRLYQVGFGDAVHVPNARWGNRLLPRVALLDTGPLHGARCQTCHLCNASGESLPRCVLREPPASARSGHLGLRFLLFVLVFLPLFRLMRPWGTKFCAVWLIRPTVGSAWFSRSLALACPGAGQCRNRQGQLPLAFFALGS